MQGAADRLAGLRVLVVEDEPLVAMLISDVLEDNGVVVLGTAASVAEALAWIEREPPQAVTLDGNLAGQVSAPVARALRARGIPFLLVTGFVDMAAADPVLSAAPRLAKPFTPAKLAQAAAAHLR